MDNLKKIDDGLLGARERFITLEHLMVIDRKTKCFQRILDKIGAMRPQSRKSFVLALLDRERIFGLVDEIFMNLGDNMVDIFIWF